MADYGFNYPAPQAAGLNPAAMPSLYQSLGSWNTTPAPAAIPGLDYSWNGAGDGYGLKAFGTSYGAPSLGNGFTPPGGAPRSIWDSALMQKNADGTTSGGYLSAGLGLAQGLGSLYLGMQQYNLAKDTLANNKAQFERNFAAQKATTNATLEDRQRARVASNANAYQSVGDYMSQNGVK